MEITEVIKEMENRKKTGDLSMKRLTCANCGSTWVELVGLIVGHREGSEDLCFRIGMESENCQECGSKDVYEIMFTEGISENVPLSFKGIKTVSRSSDSKPHEISTSSGIGSR